MFVGAPASIASCIGGWTPNDLYVGGERFTIVPTAEVDVVLNLWFHPKPIVALGSNSISVLKSY